MAQRIIKELQSDYEGWFASLPDSLQDTTQAELAAEAIEQLAAVADLISEIQLPLGYGRD